MAYCLNCEVLISDRPEHGAFCSDECEQEYRGGADSEKLAIAERDNSIGGNTPVKHTTAPDVKTFMSNMENNSTDGK